MSQKIKIMILSGVRETGKNMYAVEVNDEIYILDIGLQYPDNDLYGIDVVVPDMTYIQENISKVVGIFLSHGHADAIGALPYLVGDYDIPVFGAKMTIELAKIVCSNDRRSKKFDNFHVIDENTAIDFNEATVSFFKTTHSVPDSLGTVIKTQEGEIVYTGDFKFDQAALPLYKADLGRIAAIGNENVIALLSDSANAESPFENSNETDIYDYILDTFSYHNGRIIIAQVASNIQRMQQLLDAADKTNKRVYLSGLDAEKILKTAMKLGYLEVDNKELIITSKDLDKVDKKDLVIIETGRMGEPIKLLQKMANPAAKTKFDIEEGDLVFIATTPSHSLDTTFAKTRDAIYRTGAEVKALGDDMHPSGNANKTDLQLMINLLKPNNVIPVQGEYRLLDAHAKIAHETGIPYQNIFLTKKGDVLNYENGQFYLGKAVDAGDTMIDGIGVGDIGSIVLRDRELLAEDGVFIAVATIDRKKKKVVAKPKITARGFVYMRTSRDLLSESSDLIVNQITDYLQNSKDFDWSDLKQGVREKLNHFLYEQTNRHPVILPVIMEVNQNRHRKSKK
ncbi:ribonuclease J [Companilactobacillus mishanensis]|uniref:Ribonuclease J n=1 Tax=Companilactobacillus mishanensis TaxID=2486008 RepID=A0A5P0ZGX1_9LACO|nr:ribonuclease J [Companilactobacillus mishanensis]MQS44091.1 ribonuclease J [Companilactobacillus mishanensis]MQS52301.1 ribonuclease J [Companilactobacillus mishanensis]MQS88391.1 ribonuclease J [Companilactobacillus mishanensis]